MSERPHRIGVSLALRRMPRHKNVGDSRLGTESYSEYRRLTVNDVILNIRSQPAMLHQRRVLQLREHSKRPLPVQNQLVLLGFYKDKRVGCNLALAPIGSQ